ncbi:MAG: hypothetical protein L3K18_00765 [Thermoplasmata archaeon]|nr:hypothetical protein [Thermoplasmata archaeon]
MEPTPGEAPFASGFLDARIIVPLVFGVGLLVAAPLLWLGTHGSHGGLLALFYGGILAIVLGAVFAFFVGLFVLGSLSLLGIVWVVTERLALAFGPVTGWAAAGLVVLGLMMLPTSWRRWRDVARARRAWSELKGGSVPP